MKRIVLLALLAAALAVSCEEDPTAPPPPEPPSRMALTSRRAVLNNIEYAWNQRRPEIIDELLDANFTFYFDPVDDAAGLPTEWDRAEELVTTTALMLSNMQAPGPAPVCMRAIVDVDIDSIQWTQVPVSGSAEVWYTATISYVFQFGFENDATIMSPNGSKAQFTVREVGGQWRLVEWRDFAYGQPRVASASAEEKSWGEVKSLYE